jgi:hypothetical protein
VCFSWFECFLFFAVVGARKKLKSTLLTIFSHLSNPTPNLYVDLVALSSTRFKSSSIIFLLKQSSQDVQSNRQPSTSVLCSLWQYGKAYPSENHTLHTEGINQCSEKNDQVCV